MADGCLSVLPVVLGENLSQDLERCVNLGERSKSSGFAGAFDSCGQVNKGAWGMSWRQEA